MMLPTIVTLIPSFVMFRYLGWIDTFAPLIVPAWFGSPFFIFLSRQYFRTIPYEYDEAARVDGAGSLRIWWQVLMPMARPVVGTIIIFAFIWSWNDFLHPLIYLHQESNLTLAVGAPQPADPLLQGRRHHVHLYGVGFDDVPDSAGLLLCSAILSAGKCPDRSRRPLTAASRQGGPSMPRKVKIATTSWNTPVPTGADSSLEFACQLLEAAGASGADLCVLPEGFNFIGVPLDERVAHVESGIPGPASERISRIAPQAWHVRGRGSVQLSRG